MTSMTTKLHFFRTFSNLHCMGKSVCCFLRFRSHPKPGTLKLRPKNRLVLYGNWVLPVSAVPVSMLRYPRTPLESCWKNSCLGTCHLVSSSSDKFMAIWSHSPANLGTVACNYGCAWLYPAWEKSKTACVHLHTGKDSSTLFWAQAWSACIWGRPFLCRCKCHDITHNKIGCLVFSATYLHCKSILWISEISLSWLSLYLTLPSLW